MLPTMLEAWQLLDRVTERRDSGTDGSAIVVRRLGHHNHGGAPVTMRQVALTSGGKGLTLTTSIWTPAYPGGPELGRADRAELSAGVGR